MKTNDWIIKFKERFMEKVQRLPFWQSLSFSGGIESSAILFALVELGQHPYECITFQVGGIETKDVYFAKKICKYYDIPLEVVNIPIESKQRLIDQCRVVINIIGIARNIDVQCCHAYLHMVDRLETLNIVTGFYEDIHYEANKKLSMMYRKMKRGQLDKDYFEEYYRAGRSHIFQGLNRSCTVHNYVVIEKFLKHMGLTLHCPFKDKTLFNITQKLTFEETNFMDGRFKKKWFITQVMFKEFFDRFGNAKNSNYMHTQGMKQYHRKVLLDGTPHKDTIAVYNRIKNNEGEYGIKNEAPRLF